MYKKPNPQIILREEDFAFIVKNTPLVSIDLIVINSNNEILLGKRNNEPAKGYWFVPGGRICKNEKISDAIERILETEVGISKDLVEKRFFGVYEHLYDENVFGDPSYGTHYVVIAYEIKLKEDMSLQTDDQHSEFRWVKKDAILSYDSVHENTKAYFKF